MGPVICVFVLCGSDHCTTDVRVGMFEKKIDAAHG
jgi:hypothetical protein